MPVSPFAPWWQRALAVFLAVVIGQVIRMAWRGIPHPPPEAAERVIAAQPWRFTPDEAAELRSRCEQAARDGGRRDAGERASHPDRVG